MTITLTREGDKQPEALRLAEHDERLSRIMRKEPTYAPELRRLHEENEVLRRCLFQMQEAAKGQPFTAIAKATGEQQ
jgi:hypothetical protein